MADHSFLLVRHDVMDAQLIDRHERRIGRVDELMVEVIPGEPLRLSTIVIGGAARANRVGSVARAIRGLLNRLFGRHGDRVSRVGFDKVVRIAESICIDVDGDSLESMQLEVWLSTNIIARIPGSAGEAK